MRPGFYERRQTRIVRVGDHHEECEVMLLGCLEDDMVEVYVSNAAALGVADWVRRCDDCGSVGIVADDAAGTVRGADARYVGTVGIGERVILRRAGRLECDSCYSDESNHRQSRARIAGPRVKRESGSGVVAPDGYREGER